MADTAGSRRPADSAFKQQRLKAWQPILTPKWVIGSFMTIGVVFIGIAIAVLSASNQVLQASVNYSAECTDKLQKWDDDKVGTNCVVEFETTDNEGWEKKDVFAYYQLDNFYQNHRKYVQSKSAKQLAGATLEGLTDNDPREIIKDSSMGDCGTAGELAEFEDLSDDKKGKVYMYPCGLVALSFFNDTLKIREKESQKYVMWNVGAHDCGLTDEPCPTNPEDIAWNSDVAKKYQAPTVPWIKKNCKYIGGRDLFTSGWIHPDVAKIKTRPGGNCGAPACGLRVQTDAGVDNNGIYNCWHNVSDQDFIVWMRVAALPSFKKLYRKIPAGALKKSTKYELVVSNRFPVEMFKGKKYFVLSTTSWIGGQNFFLGYAYIVVGAICIALALGFLAKQLLSPRKMGDAKYLTFQ